MTKLNELINKLEELFELDKTDLDFGIYRLVKQRQNRIKDFLNKKLPIKVQTILGKTNAEEQADELQKYKAECIRSFGENVFEDDGQLTEMFAGTPAGKRYSEALGKSQNKSVSTQLETEVYSHLLDFFSRYYQDGDFISQRRSAVKDKYAIPYNGEEVVMHWANKDQYYIKSSENLKDYVFTIKELRNARPTGDLPNVLFDNSTFGGANAHSEVEKGNLRIKFRLAGMDAVKDNNKAKRQMVLYKEADGKYDDEGTINIEQNKNNLVIPFYFKEVKKALTIKQHLIVLENEIKELLDENWKSILLANDKNFTGKDSRTILKKHLLSYIRKQTSDFFIHKDLGKFLKNELDFYIKNEVMYLDDVINRPAEYLTSEIRKIKAIRTIAQQVIDFLAQFENFQKKLWLKKKFIYETNYCFTLDRIPQEFYPEICENKKQIEEWIKLFTINEINGDLIHKSFEDFEKGNLETKIEFLEQNKFLVLDTAFFDENNKYNVILSGDEGRSVSSFKYRLLSKIDNLDEQTDGLLIHSENFQALNLLQTKYKEKVKCIYIDPPYNTGNDGFMYKDGLTHSSWISFINDRLVLSKKLMNDFGIYFSSIDDSEQNNLINLMNSIFGKKNVLANLIWKKKYTGGKHAKHFVDLHEYIISVAKNISKIDEILMDRPSDEKAKFEYKDNFYNERGKYYIRPLKSNLEKRETLIYPINLPNGNSITTQWICAEITYKSLLDEGRILIKQKKDGDYQVYRKYYEKDGLGKVKVPSLITHTNNNEAKLELKKLFYTKEGRDSVFGTPKPVNLINYVINPVSNSNALILDYFAGSGTTGHAVINLNREDGGKRKYILVEMGNYFDTVTKPRIQKVVYSKDWKNGKPSPQPSPKTGEGVFGGVSHCFKYLRMESYEDTLNNLTLEDKHPDLLGLMLPENVKEDYLINYMLDIESRESLMDIEKFNDPFGYTLKIFNYETGEAEFKQVDLIETFNYLLGVEVQEFRMKEGFITIEGKNNANETILIIWRNVKEKSNKDLKEFISKTMRINTADTEFRAIYVNGDHTLKDPHNKIFQIEDVFQQLMFDVEEV